MCRTRSPSPRLRTWVQNLAAGRQGRPRSAADGGVLELVELRMPDEQAHRMFDGGSGDLDVALGPGHDPDEHGIVAHHERGDAEDMVFGHGRLVGFAEHVAGPAGVDLLEY